MISQFYCPIGFSVCILWIPKMCVNDDKKRRWFFGPIDLLAGHFAEKLLQNWNATLFCKAFKQTCYILGISPLVRITQCNQHFIFNNHHFLKFLKLELVSKLLDNYNHHKSEILIRELVWPVKLSGRLYPPAHLGNFKKHHYPCWFFCGS